MSKTFSKNRVLNGTFGRVWVNGEERANTKSFEAKVNLNYEDVEIADDLGVHKKYMGFEGEGTAVFHKYDTFIGGMMVDGIKSGSMPDITLVGRLSDPAAYGAERVEFLEVTFDEVTLLKFANKEIQEEEVPFKFAGFNFLDTI